MLRPRVHAKASACDRQRAQDFYKAKAFAAVDAGHALARQKAVELLPFRLRRDLLRDWASASAGGPAQWNEATRTLNKRARWVKGSAAAIGARATVERIEGRDNLNAHSSDASVKAWARRRAGECGALVGGLGEGEAFCAAREYASRWSVGEVGLRLPAEPAEGRPLWPYVARLTCARWWRRAARVMLGRGVEAAEIERGAVHRHAGVYVSDRNAERGLLAQKRNAQLLLEMDAENELGERVNLAKLAKGGVSNPWVRFSEMMVTIKGLELIAKEDCWAGRFVTWTLPSAYHARLSESGAANPNYAGHRPRDGQAKLQSLWARFRARVSHWGVRMFGLRVAEPHHDGTPHWHLMLWIQPQHAQAVCDLLRALALEEAPDEPGADRVRCKVEEIDGRGAAGYLAKYVSKMTTGAGVGEVSERCADGERRSVQKGKPSQAAQRARWWASLHGIRQFNFFGIPPRGLWREMRRIREPVTASQIPMATPAQLELFERARAAADVSDYAAHARAVGGVAVPRVLRPLVLLKRDASAPSAYGDESAPRTIGVRFAWSQLVGVVTRAHEWTLRPARSVQLQGHEIGPWTRVNNYTHGARPDPVPDPFPDPRTDPVPDWWGSWFPDEGQNGEKGA